MNRFGWRRSAAAAALSILAGLFAARDARAQFFPPLGAASPSEIATRLRAQGLILTGPLIRRDTVYLADVHGPNGRERLVLDAWSGAILQTFVSRGRNWRPGMTPYVTGGGEFTTPPPLGPPPKRDFLDPGEFAYGAQGGGPILLTPEAPQKPRRTPAKPKPTEAKATADQPAPPPAGATPAPAAQTPAVPPSSAAAPTSGAPAAATPVAPAPAAEPQKAPSSSPAPSMAESQPKPAEKAQPAPAPKSDEKSKVNNIPANTLD